MRSASLRAWTSAICAQDYHVVLWDNTTAPTSNGLSGDEVESKPGQWKNTQTAEMWIYKAGDNATGQADRKSVV